MEVLHGPVVQAFHWTCAIAMVGMALDPTGIGATIGNYVGHIGDGLGNLFNAASGAETAVHAGHAAAAPAAAPAAVATKTHVATSHAVTIAPSGIESAAHTHHDFAAAASAAPEAVSQMFQSRSEWFASLSEATQADFASNAKMLGLSMEEYTRGFCGTGIPDNWSPM